MWDVPELPDGPYPGEQAVLTAAEERCWDRGVEGRTWGTWCAPNERSWNVLDHRTVACVHWNVR